VKFQGFLQVFTASGRLLNESFCLPYRIKGMGAYLTRGMIFFVCEKHVVRRLGHPHCFCLSATANKKNEQVQNTSRIENF
jgi:hypothetical protein